MENKLSARYLRQRKMMLVLPFLALPFITMAFWALGGGRDGSTDISSNAATGLNMQLPNANLKNDKNDDKLSFYQEADADSLKRAELLRNDPYYKDSIREKLTLMDATENLYVTTTPKSGLNASPYNISADLNEQKIYKKINEINNQLNQPETNAISYNSPGDQNFGTTEQFTRDVDRMEEMMQIMNNKQEADPEMQQLNGTLEKILDIQHPQRVKDKLREKSMQQKDVAFSVSKKPMIDNISLLDTSKRKSVEITGFYGIDNFTNLTEEDNSIEAVVHANQTLVNGAIIKLRLTTDIYVSGTLIHKGSFIYGITSLNDERLEIEINSIRSGNSLFPVKLEVYDMDGLPGIHIPGAITRDVAKQSADNSLQLMELTSVDPTLKAQAAAAGISTVKNLLGRKVKQVKVIVKAEYRVLLKSKNLQ